MRVGSARAIVPSMLTKPADLSEEQIASCLRRHWEIEPTELTYAPLGAGSHHWFVETANGTEWFATLDRHPDAMQEEFRTTSYRTADALREAGLEFAHAPTRDRAGQLRRKATPEWTLSVFAYIDGRVPDFTGPDRVRIAEVIGRLHAHRPLPSVAMRWTAGYLLPELRQILADELSRPWNDGPFGERARRLAVDSAVGLQRLLNHSAELVDRVAADTEPWVVTHGQPGDAMVDSGGVRLIDWDAAMIAPRERDLRILLHGGHRGPRGWDNTEVLRVYRRASGGAEPRPYVMDVFRAEWHLMEICRGLTLFSGPHSDIRDVAHGWDILRAYLPVSQNWPELA